MIRTPVVAQVGLLDERYCYYWEELEWRLRVRAAGWRVVHVPGARLWHKGVKRDYAPGPNVTYYNTRNRFLMMARHRPPRSVWTAAWLQTARTLAAWTLRRKYPRPRRAPACPDPGCARLPRIELGRPAWTGCLSQSHRRRVGLNASLGGPARLPRAVARSGGRLSLEGRRTIQPLEPARPIRQEADHSKRLVAVRPTLRGVLDASADSRPAADAIRKRSTEFCDAIDTADGRRRARWPVVEHVRATVHRRIPSPQESP